MSNGDTQVPGLELTDVPLVSARQKFRACTTPSSYSDAIASWKAPEDIALWMRDVFRYDLERALDLAEDNSVRSDTRIFTPEETFSAGAGTCVDLCRFAVDTMRAHRSDDADELPHDRVRAGQNCKAHVAATLARQSTSIHLASSCSQTRNTPGEINGPYRSLTQFLDVYEARRKRRVVKHVSSATTFLREMQAKRRRRAQKAAAPRKKDDRWSRDARTSRSSRTPQRHWWRRRRRCRAATSAYLGVSPSALLYERVVSACHQCARFTGSSISRFGEVPVGRHLRRMVLSPPNDRQGFY